MHTADPRDLAPSARSWATAVPASLTTLRLLLAPTVLGLAYTGSSGLAFLVCLTVALLSDIFDGIVARRLGIASAALRHFDSRTDLLFYLAVLWSVWVVHPDVVRAHAEQIILILGLEVLCQVVSLARFGRQPSAHAWSGKCWGIALFLAGAALLGFGVTGWLFDLMVVIGVACDLEVIAIYLVLPVWMHDVPTIVHAWRIRQRWRADGFIPPGQARRLASPGFATGERWCMGPRVGKQASLALALCFAALPARAQAPELPTGDGLVPAPGATAVSQGLLDPNLQPVADMNAQPTPLLQQETAAATESTPAPAPRLLQLAKLDLTWLPSSGNGGLEINDVELSATFGVPLADGWAPLLLTPGAAAHFWKVPTLTRGPADLPSNLYDTYLDIGWRPRIARWLFADLGITPGVYSDFKDVSADSFQLRGRGLAIVALSPQWQFVGGALYVNRNHTKVLPTGGVIWNPNPDTRCLLVFPQPKLSHRFTTLGKTQWWGYLAGEFGGGRWSIERTGGAIDSIDYTDWRAILGVECVGPNGVKGHLEAGYVFSRTVNFTNGTPDFNPDPTVMLRVGLSYYRAPPVIALEIPAQVV